MKRAGLDVKIIGSPNLTTVPDYEYDTTLIEDNLATLIYNPRKVKEAFAEIPAHHDRIPCDKEIEQLPSGISEEWRAVSDNQNFRAKCQYPTGMTRDEFDDAVRNIEWRFAKTMRGIPHSWALHCFLIRKTRPKTDAQRISEAFTAYLMTCHIHVYGFVNIWRKNVSMSAHSGEHKLFLTDDNWAFFNRESEALVAIITEEDKKNSKMKTAAKPTGKATVKTVEKTTGTLFAK